MSKEKQNTPTNTPTYTNLHEPCKSVQSGDCKNCNNHKQSENTIELPCKVGDTVYCIWKYSDCFAKEDIPFIQESRVSGFIIEGCVTQIIPENYGEMTDKWYLLLAVAFTKEEAEEALAKMKGGAE